MAVSTKDKNRPRKALSAQTIGRRIVAYFVSLVVGSLIVASLWVSAAAIYHKILLVRGSNQIFDLVDTIRYVGRTDPNSIVANADLLKRLEEMQKVEVTGTMNGLDTILNPWQGPVTAQSLRLSDFRIVTVVPAPVCQRLLNLFAHGVDSLKIEKVEARGMGEAWRQIYAENRNDSLDRVDSLAGCNSHGPIELSFTIAMR